MSKNENESKEKLQQESAAAKNRSSKSPESSGYDKKLDGPNRPSI
ncbi:hypothetical protein [Paenibacillus sp. D9]|nr:hypothetical protein [Paenibacillus sp. D9]